MKDQVKFENSKLFDVSFSRPRFFSTQILLLCTSLHTDCGLRLILLRATRTYWAGKPGIGTWGTVPIKFLPGIEAKPVPSKDLVLLRPHQNF